MHPSVLRITSRGLPQAWITVEEAASDIIGGRVLFAFGSSVATLHGGYNKSGKRSTLAIPAIVSSRGFQQNKLQIHPTLSRKTLFARDRQMCLYCAAQPDAKALTIDHIIPRSRGGKHTWTNTCAACEACNRRKGAQTPEEANMSLLGIPYLPNIHEHLYLQNRHVVVDQMEFLSKGFRSLVTQ